MPYDLFGLNQDDDERQFFNNASRTASAMPSVGGTGGAPAQAATPASGFNTGRFVSFDRILSANQGAANQMANQVSAGVTGKIDEANKQIGLLNGQTPVPSTTGMRPGGIGGSLANRMGGNQAQISNIADPATAAKAVRDAKGAANQTKSFEGLQALMGAQYGGGKSPYSSGMSSFDAALTGAAGSGQFEALRGKFAGLESALASGTNAFNNRIEADAQRRLDDQAAADAYNGVLGDPRNVAAPTRPFRPMTDSQEDQIRAGGGINNRSTWNFR